MDVDSIPSPELISSPYLVTPTITLSPNCESSRISSPNPISDVATRRFPLTAALAKNALESDKVVRVASPSPERPIEEDMFQYYNSQGELVIPKEELLPPRIYTYSPTSPPPYDALGYFNILCPIQPPKTTSRIPTSVSQSLPTIPRPAQRIPTKVTPRPPLIRLCKTKGCNAIIPFKHYKWEYCKRCTDRISQSKADGSNSHPSSSTSVAPQLPDSRLNSNNHSNRDNSCMHAPPSFTIPTSSHRPKPLPLPARRSTAVSTTRSVSESGSRTSTLSGSPSTTDILKTSHSSNGAPNANIELHRHRWSNLPPLWQ
ncbi:hypothetical protein M378DRAFT_361937 [Amanita muscaria Koide BX008]|uniref:Uncharacterized protein n=1 Tax=Amanita muscaria (strain Koide BX008) TaxID=946122 RepID=A0A0C2WM30_AMAMK|nr:hypothetical protein M378DRAFT_361937 [Amanita muscaria Koide BX008]